MHKEKVENIIYFEELIYLFKKITVNETKISNDTAPFYKHFEKKLLTNLYKLATNKSQKFLISEEEISSLYKGNILELYKKNLEQLSIEMKNNLRDLLVKKVIIKAFFEYLYHNKLTPEELGLQLSELKQLFRLLREVVNDLEYNWLIKQGANNQIRLLIFSLLENKFDIFLSLNYNSNILYFEKNKIFYGETRQPEYQKLLTTAGTFRSYIDRFEVIKDKVNIEGFFRIPFFQPNNYVENKFTLVLKNENEKFESEFEFEKFYRRDLNNLYAEQNGFVGIRTSFSITNLINGSYIFFLRIYDKKRNKYYERKFTAATILNRYKGYFQVQKTYYLLSITGNNHINLKVKGKQSKLKMGLRYGATHLRKIVSLKHKRFKTGYVDRLLYLVSYPFLSNKDIWLISERGDTCQDNSYHLFKYIRKRYPEKKAYYIIDKNSRDYEKIRSLKNVINRDSYKHRAYILHSKILINSYDVEAYTKPSFYTKTQFLRIFGDIIKYKTVFLQHGITYNDVSSSMSKNRIGNDMIITSLPDEKAFIQKHMNYRESEVKLTGFPRYDNLRYRHNVKKEILLMPTWRRDIVPKSYLKTDAIDKEKIEKSFIESDYFKFYNSLLNSPELSRLIDRYGLKFKFYPHYEVQPFINNFKLANNKIEVLSKNTSDVQELLLSADLLITDYSSVFFDFLLMKKPVIFCHFDYEEFYNKQYKKGDFDLKSRGLGYIAENSDEVVSNLKNVVELNFEMEESHEKNVDNMFYYELDNKYSERVVNEITKLNQNRRGNSS